MSFSRLFATVGVMLSVIICTAQETLVFEDFASVDAWDGFELSDTHARSGKTSALWRNMQRTSRVGSQDIPHDWSAYSAFTFWVYNESESPNAFMCIISSENPETEGIDYWAVKVPLSFTGYKRFGVLIRPNSGIRSPRGWDQVDSIYFTASGWGNEPNPEAVVYIDRLELRNDIGGPGPLITDGEFFDLLREDIEDLAKPRQAAAQGDYDAADRHLLEYMRSREHPVWTFDWRESDGSRDADFNTARADRAMAHIFKWQGREAQLAEDIDWTASAFDASEPAYTPEWTYDLNRFGFWRDLGKAYWATGDEKYAREFISQMLDWVHDQPAPVLGSPNTGPTWRTIEQGIRTAGSWMDAYHYFLGSPSMTPHAHTTFLKSFVEHGRTLTRMALDYPQHGGNWVTMECNGLAHIGVMFPEFTEAQDWREVAYGRLLAELDRQVYPDGAQKELSTTYHQVARRNFIRALRPAQRNGFEVPGEYLQRLKPMYWYNLYAMMPGGRLPPLNDAGIYRIGRILAEAHETWGDPEFLWGATNGAEGEPVSFTSHFFPWAGQAVMRSGWDADATYLMFEIGPFGTGHQHEDKLGLFLQAYGRPLLTEAGTYSYDRSKWRRYVLSTAAHNTIMVEGMGQHRRGLRETYETKEPMSDCWATNNLFDWAVGRYDNGYGPRLDDSGRALGRDHDLTDIRHERAVIFVKPAEPGGISYFLVIDRVLGDAAELHTYSNLFHLDASGASVDDDTLTVSTQEAEAANLTLIPLATDGLSARIVSGQDEPVQGWIPRENHRKIPTAIYEKTGSPPQLFVTVLLPHPTHNMPTFEAKLVKQTGDMIAIETVVGERTDAILYAFDQRMRMEAAGISADARLAVVRRSEGNGLSASVFNGNDLRVDGEQIPTRSGP